MAYSLQDFSQIDANPGPGAQSRVPALGGEARSFGGGGAGANAFGGYYPAGGSNLAQSAADANIAAGPSLAALSQLINDINRQANINRMPGGQQIAQNISDKSSGLLPQPFLDTLKTNLASNSGGFGVDSPRLNAAALRAMGMETGRLQSEGAKEAEAFAAPLWNVSEGTITPGLLEQQQYHGASLAEQARSTDVQAATSRANAILSSQTALQQAQMSASNAGAELAERRREFDITHSSTVANQIAVLTEQARQANQQIALETARLAAQQSQFIETHGQQAEQYAQSLAENQRQFNTTTGQRQSQFEDTLANTQDQFASNQMYQYWADLPAYRQPSPFGYNDQGTITGLAEGFGEPTTYGQPSYQYSRS